MNLWAIHPLILVPSLMSSHHLIKYLRKSLPLGSFHPSGVGIQVRNKRTKFYTVHTVLFMGFSRQKYWSGLPFPSPVGHILSDLQQYVNHELPDVQAGFRKGRGTKDQIANTCWIIEKVGEFQKNIYFCFIDYAKAFDCVDHNKLWKILKEMGIPDHHLTCLLRNLYAGQEATVRTGHGTTDCFQIGKGVRQGCILSPCLFN